MPKVVPLMRAAAVRPLIMCAVELGLPIERRMDEAGMLGFPWDDVERVVPVLPAMRLLGRLVRCDGARDLGCRVDINRSLPHHGRFGRHILASRTVREVFARASVAMPRFCSHQSLTVHDRPDGASVRFRFPDAFDPEAIALAHQYTARLVVALLEAVAPGERPIQRIKLSSGDVAALGAALDAEVEASVGNELAIEVPHGILDRPFRVPGPPAFATAVPPSLHGSDLASTCRNLIDLMLDEATPDIAGLAAAVGLAVRTLQRELERDGTNFKELLDEARRTRALAALTASTSPVGAIAADLGYAGQGSLSRAMRRWEGATPQAVRAGGRRLDD